ncbi:hypothetical protein BH09MYX1_BH09MYX1_59790 [soil metagenome]
MKKRSAIVLAALLLAGNAFGETKEEIELRNAQTRFEEGLALADKGDHEEARVKFVQAYAVLKSSKVLYNLAIAEKKTTHPVECVSHLRVFLKDPTITLDLRTRAEQIIAELSKTTSRIEVAATPGADVRIDGIVIGKAPIGDPVDVAVGHHTVDARLEEHAKNVEVDTAAGEIAKVDVAFPGVLGGTPPRPFWTTPRIIGIGMLGAGLVAAGFATGFAVASSKDASQAETLRGSSPDNFCNGVTSATCTEIGRLSSSRVTEANVAMGMGIAAGAFVVAGAVLLLMPSAKKTEAAVWLVPSFGGAALLGQF